MAKRICSIPDCEFPHLARGFCNKHYQRWRKHRDPLRVDLPLLVPTYSAMHQRLRWWRGQASEFACIDCGGQAREWSYRGGAPDEMVEDGLAYSSDLNFYDPRCTSDHIRYDHRRAV